MWPSPENPDLGSFLVPIRKQLEQAGHEVEVAAISRRGGPPSKYVRLCAEAVSASRRFRPDVVFAHFLFPAGFAGLLASLRGRAPLVVMAHGQDVANLGRIPGVTLATRAVIHRAEQIVVNSHWLAELLVERVPAAEPKISIADCGIDLEAFAPLPSGPARDELGWDGPGPAFVCVGSLIERKNVIRLADAFARLDGGRLAFVGDGPLRVELEGRDGVRVVGRIPQSEVPRWVAAADVLCQPSLIEPFGQATLEGMAMERSVVATRVGGPPEFVPADAGVLVDPLDEDAILAALRRAAELPTPNPAARSAAAEHDVARTVARMLEALERARSRSGGS